jgi:hypothetical protein
LKIQKGLVDPLTITASAPEHGYHAGKFCISSTYPFFSNESPMGKSITYILYPASTLFETAEYINKMHRPTVYISLNSWISHIRFLKQGNAFKSFPC